MLRQRLRDLAICLSLSNLCFIGIWAQLFSLDSPRSYFFDASLGDFLAVMVAVALLGFGLWLLVTVARRHASPAVARVGKWLLLLVLIIPLNYIRADVATIRAGSLISGLHGATWYSVGLVSLVALGAAYTLVRWEHRITRAAMFVLLCMATFIVLTFARAVWTLVRVRPDSTFGSRPFRTLPAQGTTGRRVVVVVFDELDERLAFADRPAHLRLPEFDRIRAEGLYALNAYPPGADTKVSMPSLITGEVVSEATPIGPGDLMLRTSVGSVQRPWSALPNVFSDARQIGLNTGVVGWYHPYCRVLHASLSRCFWEPYLDVDLRGQRHSLFQSIAQELLSLSPWNRRAQYIARYKGIMVQAHAILRDTSVGFAFLHIPVPHPPSIYDGTTRTFTLTNYANSGYFDNLALADRALGELRRTLEATAAWSSTTVLITSDHWLRDSKGIDGKVDHRVPFMLMLAGRAESMKYEEPFSTIVLRELVGNVLRGNLRSAGDVSRWLHGRGSNISVPLLH